ncbi:hypothetical protein J8C06_04650 [Chloracidobacterium validum]|uniref:Uncharacterized protein n=1 Tax=Chloracidobacterium validum TaxID=2821543 RepID=A0ABX8BCG7_9BACT|nr:hypothetical protein [Chloracidobacterium validum]QUW03726.1 hypothetical protein J8C06_04650 [Chloracidobacterium validum]
MTPAEILSQLDACAESLAFPMLDAPGFRLAAARLHAYRDAERWALVIETLGCHEFGIGHAAIDNCLHVYGNCLERPPGTRPEDYLHPTSDGDECPTFDERQYVRREARTVRIRGRLVLLPDRSPLLDSEGRPLALGRRWRDDELLRWLAARYRHDLLATEAELRGRIPPDLPELLTLDAWHHPDLGSEVVPSASETFRQLAEVLATGDVTRYRPSHPSNTCRPDWTVGA